MGGPGIDYRSPGPLTDLADHAELLVGLPTDPIEICRVAQGLVIEPHDTAAHGIDDARLVEKDVRSARVMLDLLVGRGVTAVAGPVDPGLRVVGTCRHFAVLSCALLRFRGVPARARCGFAAYFDPGNFVDHWIVEHRDDEGPWVRTDTEILGVPFVAHPEKLAEGEFLTGGESWTLVRSGQADPQHFGVVGWPDNWGPSEIQGNAVRDLAALNKVEMLPWDQWGRMEEAYDGHTGPDYDELMDRLADVCAADRPDDVVELGRHEDLAVPPALVV